MNLLSSAFANQKGSLMPIVLLVLAILTLIGITATNITVTEKDIATVAQIHTIAFYAAEAGRSYVVSNPGLYGDDNLVVGSSLDFPNPGDPAIHFEFGKSQSFHGNVQYLGDSLPPKASGFEVGKYRSHRYLITSIGQGPRSSECQVEAGFYRIGF